jgi:hypothetical protein
MIENEEKLNERIVNKMIQDIEKDIDTIIRQLKLLKNAINHIKNDDDLSQNISTFIIIKNNMNKDICSIFGDIINVCYKVKEVKKKDE